MRVSRSDRQSFVQSVPARTAYTNRILLPGRQRGVAVITALLLTTLAITIVASLFWQQQVQVRSIENQRLQLQKQWVLRGLLDFGVLILKEDAKHSTTDTLTEPWTTPIMDTPLNQFLEGEADNEHSDSGLSASVIDAQSRFNLKNLCPTGACPNAKDVEAFGRLLTNLNLDPALAQATASFMQSAQQTPPPPAGPGTPPGSPAAEVRTGDQPLSIMYIDDLLSVPGFNPEILAKLKDFIIVLKEPTKVNANTASAEVLSAKSFNGELSLQDARTLVAARERKPFNTLDDFKIASKIANPVDPDFSVDTKYFLASGKVHIGRAVMERQSLIFRESGTKASVVWIRES